MLCKSKIPKRGGYFVNSFSLINNTVFVHLFVNYEKGFGILTLGNSWYERGMK